MPGSVVKTSDQSFRAALARAMERRRALLDRADVQAMRMFSGIADGVDGVFVDVYGPGAALIVYEGVVPRGFDSTDAANAVLETLKSIGVRAVYLKPFARDRSRLGGELPACVTQPAPAAGEILPEIILIREAKWQLEIRLYDGLSTGLFLDQRENRIFLSDWIARRAGAGRGTMPTVLNAFAYTCAFSVAAAIGGATTTSVDVSGRYLDWGRRNFAHNGLDAESHRFARMDTFEFLGYAKRKNLRYDLVILDPPSFGSGSKKKGIRPWSAAADYARLIHETASVVKPGGMIFASTNTRELCRPGQFERQISKGLGREPRWVKLPPAPIDFARERDRFAACAFLV